ncbi:MAG: cell division protein ZapE [Gammaproteobacteria bacterium]|nr:cell division protein ZapE [Gammaproteobacteria bacterium]
MNFIDHYQQFVKQDFQPDSAQLRVAHLLDTLSASLVQVEKQSLDRGLLERIFNRRSSNRQPKGLYLWGGVGRGKTFLMDLFYAWVPIEAKKRLHFHHFMQLVHAKLHEFEGRANPLREIAREFREDALLLCFDEFFVEDIGDAMILAELLDALFDEGLVLVATSNTHPTNLYENGLQRSRFIPAIQLIEATTIVHEIGGAHDYRLETLHKGEIYRLQFPVDADAIRKDQYTLLHREVDVATPLLVNGRELRPLYYREGIAGFTFSELCESPRNASDYIELARQFNTVVLYDVPILDGSSESAARRFVALIDEFYDRNVNVIFCAQAPIQQLYRGDQLKKQFERTVSRIVEMQADSYLTAAHRA